MMVLFVPACFVHNVFSPGSIGPFAVIYVIVTGLFAWPVSFGRCPRCDQYFNMYDPLDFSKYLIFQGGTWWNCIHCDFPYTKSKKTHLEKIVNKIGSGIGKIVYWDFKRK